jgi:ABC-2 type transport system permease protein
LISSHPELSHEQDMPSARSQVTALLRASGRSLWNAAWGRGKARRRGTAVLVVVGALGWLVAIPVLDRVLAASLNAAPDRLLTTMSGALVLLSGFTLVTSVSFAVASAYFAKDIDWLLTVPLSERGLLAHRMGSQLVLGVTVGTALLGPVLVAAAIRTGTPWLLPLDVVGLIALLTVPVALGLLLVVVAVRLIPPTRVRDGTAALICLVGLSMAAVGISSHRTGGGLAWAGAINGLGEGWLHSAALPSAWAARLLTLGWTGDWQGALGWLSALLALALAAAFGVLWISGPLYREGWLRAQLAPRRRQRAAVGWRPLPSVLALLRKDARSLRRDPVQLSQLVLPLALFAVYLLAPQSIGSSQILFRDFPLWYGPLATSLFAALFVASGLGLRAVGSEGRHFWCLRSAPLGVRDLLLGKLALPATVATVAALVLMWAAELRAQVPLGQIGFSAVLLVLTVTGLATLATGLGAIWPRLDWTDPRRASGIWLSVVFLVLGSGFIGVCLVALTVPLVIPQLGTLGSDLAAVAACALCAGLISLVTLRLGYVRLLRLEI